MSKNSHAKHEHKQYQHKTTGNNGFEKPHEDYHAGMWGDIVIFILIIGLGLFFILPFYGVLPNLDNALFIVTFLLIVLCFVMLIWRRVKRQK